MSSRRDFLSSVTALASYAGVQSLGLPLNAMASEAVESGGAPAATKRLIFVFMRGGLDGLGVFPNKDFTQVNLSPFRSGEIFHHMTQGVNYLSATPSDRKLKIHAKLDFLFNNINSTLLITHAGSMNPTRSHFEQFDYFEGGHMRRKMPTGFLARAAKAIDAESLSVGQHVPVLMRGADPLLLSSTQFLANQLSAGVVRSAPGFGLLERLRYFGARADAHCSGQTLCNVTRLAAEKLQKAANPMVATYTDDPFEVAAQVSLSQLNPRIVSIDLGGFDTHANQIGRWVNNGHGLLEKLNDGLSTLKSRLNSSWNNTVVVVMSEFGRTLVSNGNKGTDHGRGGVMIVTGGAVQANSAVPSLKRSEWNISASGQDGAGSSASLKVVTDYRKIMAYILREHLGVPQAQIFGSASGADITKCFPDLAPDATDYRFIG